MESRELVIDLLMSLYPRQARFVGKAVIEDIVDDVPLESTVTASNIDPSSALATLTLAATLLKTLLEIYFLLKQKLGRVPKRDEILTEVSSKYDGISSPSSVDVGTLVDGILDAIPK